MTDSKSFVGIDLRDMALFNLLVQSMILWCGNEILNRIVLTIQPRKVFLSSSGDSALSFQSESGSSLGTGSDLSRGLKRVLIARGTANRS